LDVANRGRDNPGPVKTIELRASMIVGHGSLSWLIVRDLTARLPFIDIPGPRSPGSRGWVPYAAASPGRRSVLRIAPTGSVARGATSQWDRSTRHFVVSGLNVEIRDADPLRLLRSPRKGEPAKEDVR
jgi:hypothetical protein